MDEQQAREIIAHLLEHLEIADRRIADECCGGGNDWNQYELEQAERRRAVGALVDLRGCDVSGPAPWESGGRGTPVAAATSWKSCTPPPSL